MAPGVLAVAGGWRRTRASARALERVAGEAGFGWLAPPLDLCTDNGAIIAWAAAERMALRGPDGLDLVGTAALAARR
jgi:N6-L-threonylcarbamoyladenine synthase